MQIEPRQTLPITRFLEDPADTDTHYVRAFVYKPATDELLATLSLVDKGSQRFVYNYEIPADPSGQGYFLHIVIKVYDDAGYTTESGRYERTQEEYLVKEDMTKLGTGGGGADISYKKIQEIVKEELDKLPKPEPQKEISFRDVLTALSEAKKEIQDKISAIKIDFPEQKETDLLPVLKAIDAIDIPQPEEIDYSRLSLEFINGIGEIKTQLANFLKIIDEFKKNTSKEIGELKSEVSQPVKLEFPQETIARREIPQEKKPENMMPATNYFKKMALIK
jgi:hypothetical protein